MSGLLSPLIEIEAGHDVRAVAFTLDGKHFVTGGDDVRVWQVQDGTRIAIMKTQGPVNCLAVSPDGGYIAVGTGWGEVFVWDADTYNQVFAHTSSAVDAVDFSPDSTRLITSHDRTAIVWDFAACKRVFTLDHRDAGYLAAAKFSPEGSRIATGTRKGLRVWDSTCGRLLVDIEAQVIPAYNTGLLWFNDYILLISDNTIKQFDALTGSSVVEWPVPDTGKSSCIVPLQREDFILYSSCDTISCWDALTRTELFTTRQYRNIRSIAVSPDNQLLAIGTQNQRIHITGSILPSSQPEFARLEPGTPVEDITPQLLKGDFQHPTLLEPENNIKNVVLKLWTNGQLAQAEALLTAAFSAYHGSAHYVLASRALVRTRLGQWDAAIVDAEESIKTRKSVIGYIAKCVALIGNGKKDEGMRLCDVALELFHSTHITTLLLIKAVALFMAGEHNDAILRISNLIDVVALDSLYSVKAYMHFFLGSAHVSNQNYENAIELFEDARALLSDRVVHHPPLVVSLISGWNFDGFRFTTHKSLCEALFAAGRVKEAGEAVLETISSLSKDLESNKEWITEFIQRCLSTPEGGANPRTTHPNNGLITGETPQLAPPLLTMWAKFRLTDATSWQKAIASTTCFLHPRQIVYWVVCERLESLDHISDAVTCFHQMNRDLQEHAPPNWIPVFFKWRCVQRLNELGETAMAMRKYDEAISHYTLALSLDPDSPQDFLVQRSKAYVGNCSWDNALDDANEIIKLDPSSPSGYEAKHTALCGAGRHGDAIYAFESMLSTLSQSSDPIMLDRLRQYVSPTETKRIIRAAVKRAICDSPPELIDTQSGRLLNGSAQALSFESQPIFAELVSSMTTEIDHARIEREVTQYYRYATFSHKWEDDEPLFDKVVKIVVYDLEELPTHKKLQNFCKLVREAGFNWAWSDTCCINKGDHFVLQEALVSMFKWYQGSAMTIVFLLGVGRLSEWGSLTESIWNKRAWTLQEYHASKVVRFYTEDWTPYMNLDTDNHKESPGIVAEMEKATGVSRGALMVLCPGLDDIREKLRLASTRETTRVEDAAYSLLGIFGISLPITYGEGNQALGRLLAQLLTSSGDTSILAWTGQSGKFNSCLPGDIAVFGEFSTSHIPPATVETEVAGSRLLSLNMKLIAELYDRLRDLPAPSFAGQRMKLPCLCFKLGPVSTSRMGSDRVFRAQTAVLGVVEIRCEQDLSRLGSLYLVHPWIDFLLDRQPVGNAEAMMADENADDASLVGLHSALVRPDMPLRVPPQTRRAQLVARLGRSFGARRTVSGQDEASLRPPSTISPTEKQAHAMEFVARLKKPFGALLLTPTRRHMEEYRRVASEALITVQVQETAAEVLKRLTDSVRVLDVL